MYRRNRRPRLTAGVAKHQQLQLQHHQQFDSITSSSASTSTNTNRQERLMLVSVDPNSVGGTRHRQAQSSVTQFCCSSSSVAASTQQQQVKCFLNLNFCLILL